MAETLTPDERYNPDGLILERFGEVPSVESDETIEPSVAEADPTAGLERLSSPQIGQLAELNRAIADEKAAAHNLSLARQEGNASLIELAERRQAVTRASHQRLLDEISAKRNHDQT